jgi:hypothetical protein
MTTDLHTLKIELYDQLFEISCQESLEQLDLDDTYRECLRIAKLESMAAKKGKREEGKFDTVSAVLSTSLVLVPLYLFVTLL